MIENPLALVAVIAFVVLVVYLVLMLIQLRRTLQRLDGMLVHTERELIPLLSDLREVAERLKDSAIHLQTGARRAADMMEALGEVGDSIHAVNAALRNGVDRYLNQGLALWAGIKAVTKLFRKSQPAEGESS